MLFIKESNDALLQHINIEKEQEIILNGIPTSMSGYVQLSNSLNETVKVRSIALTDNTKKAEKTDLSISWKLLPGEKKITAIKHSTPARYCTRRI